MQKVGLRLDSYSVRLMILSVSIIVTVVFVLEEDGFVRKVASKGDCCYSKTGERTLEAVPAGEWAGVSPCLTVAMRAVRGLFL